MIQPTIQFSTRDDFSVNQLGEKGSLVEEGFEYSSETNPHFLSLAEIREINTLELDA